jgi:hypothetical protein
MRLGDVVCRLFHCNRAFFANESTPQLVIYKPLCKHHTASIADQLDLRVE